jgi:hypothetical protein
MVRSSANLPENTRSQFAVHRILATKEGRSLAQLCEILLRGSAASYNEEGHTFLQRLISRQKKEDSSE